jgi:uncharacterized protein YndB with AHSA1/START domain
MSGYTVVREYPYSVEELWDVLTSPDWVGRWTTTGRGGRPEGFQPVPGTTFRFVGKPVMGWGGVVNCEVLEAEAPRHLRYTWQGDGGSDDVTDVTYRLEPTPAGTRFMWRHTGFTGLGGFALSSLLGSVRRRMLDGGLPSALATYHAERAA